METASSSTEQSSSAQSNREDATKRLFKSIYEQVITFAFVLTRFWYKIINILKKLPAILSELNGDPINQRKSDQEAVLDSFDSDRLSSYRAEKTKLKFLFSF